jgi:CRP-like cAMP-binding protein
MSPPALPFASLRTIPLLRGFSDDELSRLMALFTPMTHEGTLFSANERADRVYLLLRGEVVLSQGDQDALRLHPPAVIGELGPLTGLSRSCTATVSGGAEVWAAQANALTAFFNEQPAIGLRFQRNLLEVCADKISRDQSRLKDMRNNLIRTQKALKGMRDFLLESPDTVVSDRLHDMMEGLIQRNRRVNYRVAPPASLPASVRLETGDAPVLEISRTHLSYRARDGAPPVSGDRTSGVLALSGPEIPFSGVVIRSVDRRVTIELDLLIDDYAAALEGYLTRVQMVDFLV